MEAEHAASQKELGHLQARVAHGEAESDQLRQALSRMHQEAAEQAKEGRALERTCEQLQGKLRLAEQALAAQRQRADHHERLIGEQQALLLAAQAQAHAQVGRRGSGGGGGGGPAPPVSDYLEAPAYGGAEERLGYDFGLGRGGGYDAPPGGFSSGFPPGEGSPPPNARYARERVGLGLAQPPSAQYRPQSAHAPAAGRRSFGSSSDDPFGSRGGGGGGPERPAGLSRAGAKRNDLSFNPFTGEAAVPPEQSSGAC